MGWSVIGSHADEGISGSVGLEGRPGLRAALADLNAGDVLLVARRDRLARDPLVAGIIEATAAGSAARVVSVAGEGTEDDSASSVLLRRIIDAIAENFRLVLSERMKSALAECKATRRRAGQLPYGLRLDPSDPRSSKRGQPCGVVADPAELQALALVAELDQAGHSLRAIAAELTRRGFRPKQSGPRWSRSSVHRLVARIRGAGPPAERGPTLPGMD